MKGGRSDDTTVINAEQLTQKDTVFCWFYSGNQDLELSAAGAGLSLKRARLLLTRPDALALIDQYAVTHKRQTMQVRLIEGIDSLQFSPDTDVGKLLRLSLEYRNGNQEPEQFPLANVSEFKLSKDGNIEIKFFDRGRLFEALCGFANQECLQDSENNLVQAVEKSARTIWQK